MHHALIRDDLSAVVDNYLSLPIAVGRDEDLHIAWCDSGPQGLDDGGAGLLGAHYLSLVIGAIGLLEGCLCGLGQGSEG